MIISDQIAKIIEEMLDRSGGTAEVRRNDLASQIGCVPSQINYVITSRFTPERGYIIESRRGGGGFIRIVRVRMTANEYLMHFFHAIGEELDAREARAYASNLLDHGVVTAREHDLIVSALTDGSLDRVEPEKRGAVRADIMRHILMTLMR
ncbi:MAG: CtsR family transcriptional regulator [Clostridia bacterium]|nr:CtsR family transcriptional regulator [Clostridia bacterium]